MEGELHLNTGAVHAILQPDPAAWSLPLHFLLKIKQLIRAIAAYQIGLCTCTSPSCCIHMLHRCTLTCTHLCTYLDQAGFSCSKAISQTKIVIHVIIHSIFPQYSTEAIQHQYSYPSTIQWEGKYICPVRCVCNMCRWHKGTSAGLPGALDCTLSHSIVLFFSFIISNNRTNSTCLVHLFCRSIRKASPDVGGWLWRFKHESTPRNKRHLKR